MSDRSLNSKIIQHHEVKKAMDKYKNAKKNNKKDKIKYNKTKRRVSQLENESRLLWSESDEDRYFIVVCADFRNIPSWMNLVLRSYQKNSHLSPKRPSVTIVEKIKKSVMKNLSAINKRIK